MADPILDTYYRALCILHGPSGMPEDRYVTTWAFRPDTANGTLDPYDLMEDALTTFWTVPTAPSSTTPAGYLSGVAIDESRGIEVRMYDLGDQPPRQPTTRTIALPALSASVLPNEMAVALSFYAGRNVPRARGRVYLGPLAESTRNVDAAAGDVRVHQTYREAVARNAGRLMADETVDWAVISQADGVGKRITGGWVDDAFDVQRKRGVAPSVRTTFGAPG
jgi:hypothetical protein